MSASLRALDAAKADDWEAAVGMLEELRASEPLEPCYSATIAACGRAGQWEVALRLLSEYRQRRPPGGLNPVAFNAAIGACARAGQYVPAEKVLREMIALGQPPDVYTYNSLIKAAQAAGRWKDALKAMQAMRDRGLSPTAVSYSTAISACRRKRQGKAAAALVRSMREEALPPSELDLTNALSATAAQPALVEGDELWESLRAQAVAEQRPPSLRAFTAAISLSAAAGRWRQALDLLKELEGAGHAADLVTLNAVLRACGRGKAPAREAEAVFKRIGGGLAPDTYSYHALIQAMAGEGGSWQRVQELLERAHADGLGLPTRTYGVALNVLAKRGAWEECVVMLGRMSERGVEADEGCWGAAISACHAAGQWEKVYELLYQMRASGVGADADRLKPWHKGLWKQAKQKLGFTS